MGRALFQRKERKTSAARRKYQVRVESRLNIDIYKSRSALKHV